MAAVCMLEPACEVCPACIIAPCRPLPCLAVVPWTPPNYFIARALAMSERQSASQLTQ